MEGEEIEGRASRGMRNKFFYLIIVLGNNLLHIALNSLDCMLVIFELVSLSSLSPSPSHILSRLLSPLSPHTLSPLLSSLLPLYSLLFLVLI